MECKKTIHHLMNWNKKINKKSFIYFFLKIKQYKK